jgi:hypothetical protein
MKNLHKYSLSNRIALKVEPLCSYSKKCAHPGNGIAWKHTWLILVACCITFIGFAQVQVLPGGNMESNTNWVVYHQGSATPAAYTFNYTAQKPTQGVGGCLRITSSQRTNILFWQKIAAKAGETYTVNGAIRTNNVANFWAEVYVSTVPPVEGSDYSPNNNTDVVEGFSTWFGCGSNVNGTFAANACTGKNTYVVPGSNNANVDIYFAFKTGTSALPVHLLQATTSCQCLLERSELQVSPYPIMSVPFN